MFSTGQIIFAIGFAVVFAIVIIISYKKDFKLHQKNFKGVKWIGLFFVLFLVSLFCIKFLLKD
jgi:membrane protease YdiL (CAAX protease family)